MEIGYSVPTILNGIIKQAQDITSEARWMEFYCHSVHDENQIGAIKDTIDCIEAALLVVKLNIELLESEDM